mmetsp:Transcript_9713/g.29254  ORF Transcript_9713/g.29254 Transcript_9713/m.29254 type:complete len:206 (-) Transcript_9713:221-838(-)
MAVKTAKNLGYWCNAYPPRPTSISNRKPVMMGDIRLHVVHTNSAAAAMKRCFRCENMSCLMYLSSSGARLTGWYLPGTAAAASTAAVDAPFPLLGGGAPLPKLPSAAAAAALQVTCVGSLAFGHVLRGRGCLTTCCFAQTERRNELSLTWDWCLSSLLKSGGPRRLPLNAWLCCITEYPPWSTSVSQRLLTSTSDQSLQVFQERL